MCGVESELFAVAALFVDGAFYPPEFVVRVIQYAAALVGGLDQVAGLVVAVASAYCAAGCGVCVSEVAVADGALVFQTALGVVTVQAV
nr:hypothetical protein [Neisseria zoodegmatis]